MKMNLAAHKVSGLAGLVCIAFLASCSTPNGKVQSRKDPAYQGKLERVLLVYDDHEKTASLTVLSPRSLGPKFSAAFLRRLTEVLTEKGVTLEVVRPDPEALDPDAPAQAAATRFHPDHLLRFGIASMASHTRPYSFSPSQQQELLSARFTQDTEVVFGFSLVDPARHQIVWRGELSYYVIPFPEHVADQFVQQLAAEKFLQVGNGAWR
jgi:hypothetical protein